MSQITSHEGHITEYTDKITAMEEEIRKVRQLDITLKNKLINYSEGMQC